MNKLYRDTVTLYHADAAAQTVVRTVLRGVCWQQGRRQMPEQLATDHDSDKNLLHHS